MQSTHRSVRALRSVFVSDVHLGCRHSQFDSFLSFLKSVDPRHLYLVGDFLDGWEAARLLEWNQEFNGIIHRLMEMADGEPEG